MIVLILVTLVAFCAYIAGTFLGITLITTLLFYFPIILAAYWFPRKGVLFSVGVGILQVFFVYLFRDPTLPDITFAVTTASFYVLVAIAVVISSLSGGLKERETRYRGIFNSSEAGIFLVHNGGSEMRIDDVNPRGGMLLGCHSGDLKGESLSLYWRDEPAKKNLVASMQKDGAVEQLESVVIRGDGTTVPVLISGSTLPGKMMVLTMIDITARKAQEEELRARNQQLSTLNRVIADASAASGLGEMATRVLVNLLDYLGCEFGGMVIYEEGSDRIIARVHQGDERLFHILEHAVDATAAEWMAAIRERRDLVWRGLSDRSGRAPQSGVVVPLRAGDQVPGIIFFLSCQGQTCSKDQHETLESLSKEIGTAVARLVLSKRIAETNQQANLYLDILMHDINNANLASLWYGDLLQEMLSGEAKVMARKMIEGIEKSRQIIRNLEIIRKIQVRKNDLKPVSLDAVIQKEMQLFEDADIEYHPSGMQVWADDLIGEIFNNLLGNSVKFGGPGVRVTISAEPRPPGLVQVLVSDNGPGIPDDLKKVIFRRFTLADQQNPGKGLGLYIIKTLLERYGGSISVSDRVPGDHAKGTIFSLTLRQAFP